MNETESLTRQFILNENTPFIINETYAKIRTALLAAAEKSVYSSFVITSQCRGEGKTTTAVNLGISLSRLEKRVLLIDCDLRRSSLCDMLRLKNRFGLTGILSGECDLYSGINMDVRTNFHVITSGPKVKNPADILRSADMQRLMLLLYDYYDHIIIDTPPLCIANDALLMRGFTGGIVLVVRENKTTHNDLRAAASTLKLSGAKVFGVIKTYCDLKYDKRDDYRSMLSENAADFDEKDILDEE